MKPQQAFGKKTRIQNWLMQEGWQVGEAQAENAAWALLATNQNGQGALVIQPQQFADMLFVQANMAFDESFRQQYQTLDQAKRQQVLWSLRIGLVQMNVDFEGIQEPFERLSVSQRIYDDGLTKDNFAQRVMQVKMAMFFAVWTIMRAMEQPPPDTWPESIGGVS